MNSEQSTKNIIICLDGTGNQFGENLSNIVKLYRMLEREPSKQITYYDPGVGTMGDPTYKTTIGKEVNKVLGLAFGRGVMNNVIEAYTFLMDNYEDGDKVFIFGFSRGAYTARALAAFIKDIGLLEKGANNLFPYALELFKEKVPNTEKEGIEFYKKLSSFRSTYGRLLNQNGDPRNPKSKEFPNYQLRVHFLGLFDTVKSYGWVTNPVIFRNEEENPSVLNVRHALAIDEKRSFFRQMHWKTSKRFQSCKEVWFAGVHSDVGGGYPESDSGLAKVALEWMVHEAISFGMRVDKKRYGLALQRKLVDGEWQNRPPVIEDGKERFSAPNPLADANESLKGAWKIVQVLPKKLEEWEVPDKSMRTIKGEQDRLQTEKELNPFFVHRSVIDRMNADLTPKYQPKNLKNVEISEENIEDTIPLKDVFS